MGGDEGGGLKGWEKGGGQRRWAKEGEVDGGEEGEKKEMEGKNAINFDWENPTKIKKKPCVEGKKHLERWFLRRYYSNPSLTSLISLTFLLASFSYCLSLFSYHITYFKLNLSSIYIMTHMIQTLRESKTISVDLRQYRG